MLGKFGGAGSCVLPVMVSVWVRWAVFNAGGWCGVVGWWEPLLAAHMRLKIILDNLINTWYKRG